jgi:hypothetical protein
LESQDFFVSLPARNYKREKMEATLKQPFNAAQLELLGMLSCLKTDENLRELKHALSVFFAERADKEMDRLWQEGVINEQVIEGWKNEHMRTPYNPKF